MASRLLLLPTLRIHRRVLRSCAMSDTGTALLSILGSWLSGGALLWLGRTWISERLKQSIANEYALALERHKADLAAANAADLERVKASYADQRAIRALGEDSFREAMRVSHTKRVDAIQVIWDAIIKVSEGAPPVMTYVDVLFEKDLPNLLTSRRGRAALDALTEEEIIEKILIRTPEITAARLLAGPYLYSLLFAYRAIVGRATSLVLDGRNEGKAVAWYRHADMRELFDAVFSAEELKTFDALERQWMRWVRDTIEAKFQQAATDVIMGADQAKQFIQKAREIEAAVEKVEAKIDADREVVTP